MRRLGGSFTLRVVAVYSLVFATLAPAATYHDVDDDGDVDLADFASLQRCYNQTTQGCLDAHDYDEDNDIDEADFANYESVMVEPLLPPLPDAPLESAGYPRDWQGALPVSPFSVYNLAYGNLHTALPLVSWEPVGPPVEFVLYHDNASAVAGQSGADGQGFALGPGWSTSYSGRVVEGQEAGTVIEDDGTRNMFALVDGTYEPRVGVHDRLEHVEDVGGDYWLLTRVDQSQREFDASGLLTKVRDSSGNEVSVARDVNGRIDYVASTADGLLGVGNNRLIFNYTGAQLTRITDPIGRYWTFEYDGSDTLWKVHNPDDNYVPETHQAFTYDADGRLTTVTRRDENTWTYDYTPDGRLQTITDPPVNLVQYTQTLTDLAVQAADCVWRRTHTDRSGETWQFDIDDARYGRLVVAMHDPLTCTRDVGYDAEHNVVEFTDELGHTWTATYGPVGNLETLTGPGVPVGQEMLQQTWALTWEAVGDPDTTNFYRLTQFTDPAGKCVHYVYGHPQDGTLVTQMIEMADGQSNPQAQTDIGYYWDDLNARGQPHEVVDANGVKTEYTYDKHGYIEGFEEGFNDPPTQHYPVSSDLVAYDAVGRPTSVSTRQKVVYCEMDWDAYDNLHGGGGAWFGGDVLGKPPSPNVIDFSSPTIQSAAYNNLGQLTGLDLGMNDVFGTGRGPGFESTRSYDIVYDEIGRPSVVTVSSQPGGVARPFSVVEYDPEGRPLWLIGPDNEQVTCTYTDRGELETITRDGLTATLHYDDAWRLDRIDYDNGTGVDYAYDDADRVQQVRHFAGQNDLLVIDYAWTINNLVGTRTETDYTVQPATTAVVSFAYDDRGQLIHETRVVGSLTVYDLAYTYDQLGNRETKFDGVTQLETRYTYDLEMVWDPEDPDQYPTRNNRLLYYELYDVGQLPEKLLRTVSYTYYDTGDASNVTIKDEDPTGGSDPAYDWHHDLALYYEGGRQMMRMALWDRWQTDANGDPIPETYGMAHAREFRCEWVVGDPRERYLTVDGDPNAPNADPNDPATYALIEPIRLTDYLGSGPYADADLTTTGDPENPWSVAPSLRYLFAGAQETVGTAETQYYHGDLIGSTMLTTDETGAPSLPGVEDGSVAYTAFGEILDASGSPGGDAPQGFPRYQYAGAWGYESGLLELQGTNPNLPPITLQHVGWRWYDAAAGRFVQRDPIGVMGGLNVYAYLANEPLVTVDPLGLYPVPLNPRDWWEMMRRYNRTIARALREMRHIDPRIRAAACRRFAGAYAARLGMYAAQWGPLLLVATCVDLYIEALKAAQPYVNDWLDDAALRVWNKRLRKAGFGPVDTPGVLVFHY